MLSGTPSQIPPAIPFSCLVKQAEGTGSFGPFTCCLARCNHPVMKTTWHTPFSEDCGNPKQATDYQTIVSNSHSSRAGSLSAHSNRGALPQKSWAVPHWSTGAPNSVRIPATAGNQGYLKLLRKAEYANWNGQPVEQSSHSPRLPSMTESRTERWVLRLLGVVAIATAGYAIIDSSWLFESWASFARWARFAIGV